MEIHRGQDLCIVGFFFFQAEDGIRDYKVTGVQTCALPICMLAAFLWVPHWPVMAKMGISAVAALLGTALFLAVLSRIRLRSSWMVPLVGLVLAGVLEAAASFLALQFDMMQALKSWSNGDFSLVVQGRYELLWLSLGVTALACLAADRFTVAGPGGG